MNPNSLAFRTISTVTPPAGSPNSMVPSISKLMRKANFRPPWPSIIYMAKSRSVESLDGGRSAPNQRVARVGHGSTGDADLVLFLDLRGRPPLQLENAVPM